MRMRPHFMNCFVRETKARASSDRVSEPGPAQDPEPRPNLSRPNMTPSSAHTIQPILPFIVPTPTPSPASPPHRPSTRHTSPKPVTHTPPQPKDTSRKQPQQSTRP